ncbi:SUKH-4 family immunity protein [Streptomyces sp. NPDC090442]|uniref:SUKH-4 family immunity protein n=1 Tax=Streptomyces sp. NPDC090442 TaxID=3365962 RepID=UPI00381B0B9E
MAFASVGFTTPHRLTLLDAATGERLAPAMLCDADEDTFALVAGPASPIGVGTRDIVEPLDGTRHAYAGESSSGVGLLTTVTGSPEPRIVTAHPYEGIRVWDVAAHRCLVELPLPELRSPDCLCAGLLPRTTGLTDTTNLVDATHPVGTTSPVGTTTCIAVSEDGQVSVHEAETGRLMARWTASETRVTHMIWARSAVGGRDALLTTDTEARLRAWDPRTGEPLGQARPLPGRPLHLSATVLEAEDTRLPLVACAYGDGVYLLGGDADTGQALLDLRLSAWTRTVHLAPDGLLLLGTSAGPLALRLDAGRLAAGSGERTELDLTGIPAPESTRDCGGGAERDAAGLPSHSDLVDLWGADQVLVLDDGAASADLAAQAREVLCGIGLPRCPVPGLSLDRDLATDGPAPLDEVGVGPEDPDDPDALYVPEGMDAYHWLGTWHDDDLVLSPAGAVEIVGAETDYEEATLLNSSLAAFVTFAREFALVALQQEPEYDVEAQEARVERLERRLRTVDEAAFAPDSAEHWADALSDLESGT